MTRHGELREAEEPAIGGKPSSHSGSQVELHLQGRKMTVEASKRPRYKLPELMTEMTSEPPRVEGWDDMPLVGMERD
jgi:hypothetical protein